MIIKTLQPGKKLSLKESGFQFFNEDPGSQGEGTQGTEGTQTAADKTLDTKTDPNKDEKLEADKGDPEKDKAVTFTQEQVSKVAAAEAKKAKEKILKELGIEDVGKGKEALKAYKKQIDDQKTDAEKAKDRADALEKETGTKDKQIADLTTQLAAIKADVDPDKLEDVTFLASKYVSDDVTVEDAIGKVLEKYPQFKREQVVIKEEGKKKPALGSDEYKSDAKVTDQDKWNNAFKI